MIDVTFSHGGLTEREQSVVARGFEQHSQEQGAPAFDKRRLKWIGTDKGGLIRAALTAEILWDWMYLDELWVCRTHRGEGVGKHLVRLAEQAATSEGLQGVWLWTQSWQAAGFYSQLGYHEFCQFPNFPEGHQRIGLRKDLSPSADSSTPKTGTGEQGMAPHP